MRTQSKHLVRLCLGLTSFALPYCSANEAKVEEPALITETEGKTLDERLVISPLSKTGHDKFMGVVVDGQGFIYAVGVAADTMGPNADVMTMVAKFDSRGVLDPTFGTGGTVRHNLAVGKNGEAARGIALQSDGKVVVAATVEHPNATDARDRDVAVLRLNQNGTLDASFGDNGVRWLDLSTGVVDGNAYRADNAWNVLCDAADRILVGGTKVRFEGRDTDFAITRLTKDGALDASFATDGVFSLDIANQNASVRQITLLADGSILGTGYMNMGAGTPAQPVVYKLDTTGKLDPTFGEGGVFTRVVLPTAAEVYAVAAQGDKLVTVGYGRRGEHDPLDWVSMRLTADGQLDTTYGDQGVVMVDVNGFDDNGRSLVVLHDKRIIGAGRGRQTVERTQAMLASLTEDGGRDQSFADNGIQLFDLGGELDSFEAIALSKDQKFIVAVGSLGVGNAPSDPDANDDAALLILPTGI